MGIEAATKLAEFTARTRYEDLSPGALLSAKQLTLKTVAGMLAGSRMDGGAKIADFVRRHPDGSEASVVGHGFRASMWKTVFANAYFAHQSELEDDRLNAGTSWDITTIPMLFALAQVHDLSGADMLTTAAVGLEVMARTCQFYPQGHLGLSVVPPSVGPAALASRAMGLDAEQTAAAFGLAMSGAPLSYVSFGTDAHFLETSVQTLHGLIAAQGAAMGLTSNPDLVRYIGGLVGAEHVSSEAMTDGLGSEWQFTQIWVKKYPCCLYNHRYIDGTLDVVREHGIGPDDIERIDVHVAAGVMETCNRPTPRTIGDLQFSFQHTLSSTLIDGDVNYRHIQLDLVDAPAFVEMRKKVDVTVHPEWKSRYAVETPALLEFYLKDGRKLSNQRQYPTGSPGEPLSLEFVQDLFVKFVGDNLPDADRRFAAGAIGELERLDRADVKHLLALLNRDDRRPSD